MNQVIYNYYHCKDCKILIKVISQSRNSHLGRVSLKLPSCPHCGKQLKISYQKDFDNSDFKIWHRLFRKYKIRGSGQKKIIMSVKFQ